MAWKNTKTWLMGDVPTAADANDYWSGNPDYLRAGSAQRRWGMHITFVDDDTVSVGVGGVMFPDGSQLIVSTATNVTFADLDTGSRTVGKDYYVFATGDGIKLSEIPQTFPATKEAPAGYTTDNSLLIGYFHNAPDWVGGGSDGAIMEHSIVDYALIHEAFNFDYPYRAHPALPAGIPLPGMTRVGGIAIGIYQASHEDATATSAGSSPYPTSRYGVVPWTSIQGWAAMSVVANAGYRLPSWAEWLSAATYNPGSATPARLNGNTYYGSSSDGGSYLTTAGAPTVAVNTAAGNLTGDYYYKVTFVNANGETQGGTASAVVSPSAQQVDLSAIPIGGAGTTARKIYRTEAGGSTYKLAATINDNTTTTYTDNLADGDLGATAPTFNTTGDQVCSPDPTYAGRGLTGTGPRTTSVGTTTAGRSWWSAAGADFVGNVWEWVAEFFGGLKTSSPGTGVSWGSENDTAYNFEGEAYNPDTGGWTAGLPALLYVGGSWRNAASAGVRAAGANSSPGHASTGLGFRLAR